MVAGALDRDAEASSDPRGGPRCSGVLHGKGASGGGGEFARLHLRVNGQNRCVGSRDGATGEGAWRVSAPESEDDIALCSLCRCEIPTDEVFWCLNRGCEYACYGVCFECLTGHVCRVAPVEISPLATG